MSRWGMLLLLLVITQAGFGQSRKRVSELGIRIGVIPAGKLNAITDVPGLKVGQVTLIRGDSV